MTSYITKNLQGPVTLIDRMYKVEKSYITKNIQGPVTKYICNKIYL